MKILFLYTELADYTLACLKNLKKKEAEIMVIHFPVNPEAPFLFQFQGIGAFKCVDEFRDYESLVSYIKEFNPEKIVCCGWIKKWYLRICWEYKRKAVCILTLDNHWYGSTRQHILAAFSTFTLRKIFRKIWIPGDPQASYARKFGFSNKDILKGFYCCDVEKFNEKKLRFEASKHEKFPHRFLCVARYIPAKNYNLLWQAFIDWKQVYSNDWELWCAGTGEFFSQRIEHPAIRHLGFVQNEQWDDIIAKTGVFILPSKYEPWGVVVHEFAAAGYPMILSKNVGAVSVFLEHSNGLRFNPENKEELISLFQKINSTSDSDLNLMGNSSFELSKQITPHHWSEILLNA